MLQPRPALLLQRHRFSVALSVSHSWRVSVILKPTITAKCVFYDVSSFFFPRAVFGCCLCFCDIVCVPLLRRESLPLVNGTVAIAPAPLCANLHGGIGQSETVGQGAAKFYFFSLSLSLRASVLSSSLGQTPVRREFCLKQRASVTAWSF